MRFSAGRKAALVAARAAPLPLPATAVWHANMVPVSCVFLLRRAALRGGKVAPVTTLPCTQYGRAGAGRQTGRFRRVFIAQSLPQSIRGARPLALWRALPLLRAARGAA